ncbi:hypothetical protein FE257_011844 [Aspergillus nanangensis]|uniref:CCHC-type domain-containing protein n=1 Tax=Aspergillus nanangensis TaxID=2582783 RepID=A0AAD4GXX8_ASPNN|nr:hypothetical protein FE257_011844 [Aspergillus nanangensis]
MSFFTPDQLSRVCTRCGACGMTKNDCLNCNICVYCKKEGHVVAECDIAPPCGRCGKKGHPQRSCPEMKARVFARNAPKVLKKGRGDTMGRVNSQITPTRSKPVVIATEKVSRKRKNGDLETPDVSVKPKQPKYVKKEDGEA